MIARGTPETRGIAGGSLGLLGPAAGAIKFPGLLHGVVLSVFPPNGARALVALTVWSAAAATLFGLVVFESKLDPLQELAEP